MRFVLTGPQGIGKTREAQRIAAALGIRYVVDDWDGEQDFRDDTLAITLPGLVRFENLEDAVVIEVTSEIALQSLITALEQAAASKAAAV